MAKEDLHYKFKIATFQRPRGYILMSNEGQLNLDPELLGYKIDFLIPILNPDNFEDGKKSDVDLSL